MFQKPIQKWLHLSYHLFNYTLKLSIFFSSLFWFERGEGYGAICLAPIEKEVKW